MGIVRMGPPTDIIVLLKERFSIRNFVETGTFQGGTTAWAAGQFENVVTIEGSEIYHRNVQPRLAPLANVQSLLGDTRKVMPGALERLSGDALFWLDSHWCSVDSFGAADQCPLLQELSALRSFRHRPYLFIDDARLFLSPPPRPNLRDQWPTIDEVVGAIKELDDRMYIVVFDDSIIAVPAEARETLAEFVQNANSERWQNYKEAAPRAWDRLKRFVRSPSGRAS